MSSHGGMTPQNSERENLPQRKYGGNMNHTFLRNQFRPNKTDWEQLGLLRGVKDGMSEFKDLPNQEKLTFFVWAANYGANSRGSLVWSLAVEYAMSTVFPKNTIDNGHRSAEEKKLMLDILTILHSNEFAPMEEPFPRNVKKYLGEFAVLWCYALDHKGLPDVWHLAAISTGNFGLLLSKANEFHQESIACALLRKCVCNEASKLGEKSLFKFIAKIKDAPEQKREYLENLVSAYLLQGAKAGKFNEAFI
jgi:hypothetical protein